MTFYGFDFSATGTLNYAGSDAGRPLINSAVSNPLNNEGVYARSFWPQNTNVPASGNTQTLIKADAENGAFDAIHRLKRVSLRAWVRLSVPVATVNLGSTVGLCAKASAINSGTAEEFSGYRLRLGNISSNETSQVNVTQLNLELAAVGSNGQIAGDTPIVVCTGSYGANTWYRIRLDVFSLNSTTDRLIAYTGTGNVPDEDWTEVGTFDVSNSSATYQPWSDSSRRFGYYQATHTTSSSSTYKVNAYIDRFVAIISDNN